MFYYQQLFNLTFFFQIFLIVTLVSCRANLEPRNINAESDLGVRNDLNEAYYDRRDNGNNKITRAGDVDKADYSSRSGLGQGVYVGTTKGLNEPAHVTRAGRSQDVHENPYVRPKFDNPSNGVNQASLNDENKVAGPDRSTKIPRTSSTNTYNQRTYAERRNNLDKRTVFFQNGNYNEINSELTDGEVDDNNEEANIERTINPEEAGQIGRTGNHDLEYSAKEMDDNNQGANIDITSDLGRTASIIQAANYNQEKYDNRAKSEGPNTDRNDPNSYTSDRLDRETPIGRHGNSYTEPEIKYNLRHSYVPTRGGSTNGILGDNNNIARDRVFDDGLLVESDYNINAPNSESFDNSDNNSPTKMITNNSIDTASNDSTSSDIYNSSLYDHNAITNRGEFGTVPSSGGMAHRGFHNIGHHIGDDIGHYDNGDLSNYNGQMSYNDYDYSHGACNTGNCQRVTKTTTTTTCESCKQVEVVKNNCDSCKINTNHECDSCKIKETNNNNNCDQCKIKETNPCDSCKVKEPPACNNCDPCKQKKCGNNCNCCPCNCNCCPSNCNCCPCNCKCCPCNCNCCPCNGGGGSCGNNQNNCNNDCNFSSQKSNNCYDDNYNNNYGREGVVSGVGNINGGGHGQLYGTAWGGVYGSAGVGNSVTSHSNIGVIDPTQDPNLNGEIMGGGGVNTGNVYGSNIGYSNGGATGFGTNTVFGNGVFGNGGVFGNHILNHVGNVLGPHF